MPTPTVPGAPPRSASRPFGQTPRALDALVLAGDSLLRHPLPDTGYLAAVV